MKKVVLSLDFHIVEMEATVNDLSIVAPSSVFGVAMMTEAQARECVLAIKASTEKVRRLLLDLYEREGWKALGYPSFRSCVVQEFDVGQSHAYQLLNAARVDRILALDKPMPEGQARVLAPLIKQPEVLRSVAAQVQEEKGAKAIATDYRAAVGRAVPKPTSGHRAYSQAEYRSGPAVEMYRCATCGERVSDPHDCMGGTVCAHCPLHCG